MHANDFVNVLKGGKFDKNMNLARSLKGFSNFVFLTYIFLKVLFT